MLTAGVLAAVVSFLQVAFMIGIFVHVGQHGGADGTRTLFNAINKADTVKLILLAVFVGAASWAASRNGALARWVAWLGAVTVVFLVVGGLVLLDSTPEAVSDDRAVQAGFVASGLAARLLKLLTPLGFTRLLLRWQKMPLYPEQSHYQAVCH